MFIRCLLEARTSRVWVCLGLLSALLLYGPASHPVAAHKGHYHPTTPPSNSAASSEPATQVKVSNSDSLKEQARQAFDLLTAMVAQWPLTCRETLIAQAALERQMFNGDPEVLPGPELVTRRTKAFAELTSTLQTVPMELNSEGASLSKDIPELVVCNGLPTVFLLQIHLQQLPTEAVTIRAAEKEALTVRPILPAAVKLVSDQVTLIPIQLQADGLPVGHRQLRLQIQDAAGQSRGTLTVPVSIEEATTIKVSLVDRLVTRQPVAGRVTVQCSDGIARLGGVYAGKSTFNEKPIIFPPIGTWQKLSFFYSDGGFEMKVPPGVTKITFDRGFEYARHQQRIEAAPGSQHETTLACKPLIQMASEGWISGDNHVHWVTNAWNVDEPLGLLEMVQRAEGLRVANNLTLLQRYANQAFVKPSQAPMGPVKQHSADGYHIQMGEEYRNEDLYGHLCFLNIDWLVQPIGTGGIIAGPDALDYPINRTAIEACRDQGGISIEAHGTGGNKDVPINVIHQLTDSLDQMEPELYYRLLDCGFRLPLTNGSDHPARPVGIARAYVHVQGDYTYQRWIEGIRQGRTFTTSGPLLFLTVNESMIGDTLYTDADQELHVIARVVSRDPIGRFQVISNGEVLAEQNIAGTEGKIELRIPAEKSRWIVARCSHRSDGRSDFGFGNFNAITGPGIAHTSPVYVSVDGLPRFDNDAPKYWMQRMRQQVHKVQSKGRFANDRQRKEAVGYLERGIEMFRDLEAQVVSSRARDETSEQWQSRMINLLRRFADPARTSNVVARFKQAADQGMQAEALDRLVLCKCSVDPKQGPVLSVKKNQLDLLIGRPQRFLIRIDNPDQLTGRLRLRLEEAIGKPSDTPPDVRLELIDSPFTSVMLTGATVEYKVLELSVANPAARKLAFKAVFDQRTGALASPTAASIELKIQPRRTHADRPE